MRRFSTLAALIVALYSIFSYVGAAPQGDIKSDNSKGELVDIKANLVYPHKINDTLSVLCLVGDFAAQHNGAVITADSAVRYEDERLECFGNVLINKNTTYAYADRADYDSANNLAALFAPVVKVVDEDIILYTHNFTFNTLENIGKYWDGGVTTKLVVSDEEPTEDEEPKYDVMESVRGYYYSDTKSVIGVERVELEGDGYQMTGDSVIYEMENERAIFFGATNIWSEDGDYIYGDAGLYDKAQGLYSVTENGYLLTKEQEVWGDSLEYYREREEAILRNNVQIVDTTNKSIALSDFAQYWGESESALLTRNAIIINYDTQQPQQQIDTLYLRGDTIRLNSYVNGTGPFTDSLAMAGDAVPEGILAMMSQTDSLAQDETPVVEAPIVEGVDIDATEAVVDSLIDVEGEAKIATDTIPTKRELKARERKLKEEARISADRVRTFRKLDERRAKLEERIADRRERNKSIYSDSMVLIRVLTEIESYKEPDTLSVDTLVRDSLLDTLNVAITDSIPERDSLYRVFTAHGNVRSYRRDFQMVCDSLVANSYDTVLRLYVSPIVWSDNNQITADEMVFYTLDSDLDYADFFGDPIMASMVLPNDTIYINQVKGKEMRAFFENNNVTRNDVNGNVQTLYYMQDEESLEVNTVAFIESGSATFLIEEQQLDGVIYRQEPTYTFAPLSRKPANIVTYLDGFEWQSARRPVLDSVLNRKVRPSLRAERSSRQRPTFPIQQNMDNERKKLEKSRLWVDRIELVSPEVMEWMRELGFTPGEPRPEGSGF